MEVSDETIDSVFDRIEKLSRNYQYGIMNRILQSVDIENTSEAILLSYLTATLSVRSHLLYRNAFYRNVEAELRSREGYTPDMLDGLN
jgi:hypothetical protein